MHIRIEVQVSLAEDPCATSAELDFTAALKFDVWAVCMMISWIATLYDISRFDIWAVCMVLSWIAKLHVIFMSSFSSVKLVLLFVFQTCLTHYNVTNLSRIWPQTKDMYFQKRPRKHYCNILQHTATYTATAPYIHRHTTTHCNKYSHRLRHSLRHCNTLQHMHISTTTTCDDATHCNT